MYAIFNSIIAIAITAVLYFTAGERANEKEIIEADARLNLLIMNNNAAEAAPYYMEDFILITAAGKMVMKSDIVAQIASPELKLSINETTEVRVRVHDDVAVLTGVLHQKGSYKDKSFDAWLRVTDTWIKTPEGWRLLSGHAGTMATP